MKKYTKKSVPFFSVWALVSLVLLMAGICLTVFKIGGFEWPFCCIFLGTISSFFSILFFIDERSRYICLFDDKIELPKGILQTSVKAPKWIYRRTVIYFSDLISMHGYYFKPDDIVTFLLGPWSHWKFEFVTKDRKRYEMCLFGYGKQEEQEIYDFIQSKCN